MTKSPSLIWSAIATLLLTGCGDDATSHETPPDGMTGMLLVHKQPDLLRDAGLPEVFCSGTLIASDVVLTSARCARVAARARVGFALTPRDAAVPHLVRAAVAAPDAPAVPCADPQDPYADASDPLAVPARSGYEATPEAWSPDVPEPDSDPEAVRRSACHALRARCGVRNISAPDAATLACLHRQAPELLSRAGFCGFGAGHDLGLLFLETPVHAASAALADPALQNGTLGPSARPRAVHFAQPSDKGAVPGALKTAAPDGVERGDAGHTVAATRPNELRLITATQLDTTDRGGALFVHQSATDHTPERWSLAAVASRPWLIGGDTEAGMIYSRIDAPARKWMQDTLQRAAADGRRTDACGDAGLAWAEPITDSSCAQAAPGWLAAVLSVGWLVHRSGRARRGARARLMYAWPLAGVAMFAGACGDGSDAADITHVENVSREAIVQGKPTGDRFLAVGAVVVPGTNGADPYQLRCTGTLVAEDVVLTAAHCVPNFAHFQQVGRVMGRMAFRPGADSTLSGMPATIQVRHAAVHPTWARDSRDNGGSHNTFCPEGRSRPDRDDACAALVAICGASSFADLRIISFPQPLQLREREQRARLQTCVNAQDEDLLRRAGYLGVQDDHDFALLFLEAPVPNARPARLAEAAEVDALKRGMLLTGVGYGEQALNAGEQPLSSRNGIKHVMDNHLEELGGSEMRLGVGPPQACHADSGGPAFSATSGEGEVTLLGVVSRLADSRSPNCDRGVIYGRVDRVRDWLRHATDDACREGLRYGCRPEPGGAEPRAALPARNVSPVAPESCQSAPGALAAWVVLAAAGTRFVASARKKLGFPGVPRRAPCSRSGTV